ncbi:hypothetical protein V525_14895 [Gordonia alkanivorans CGMCC 6845]|uniref:Uncharacterized protein n=1 Tax=Gordonia alkanivorans CGMCC 6845 TaxID=1423140 RepID=W9DCJ5_9ACTN|nr:hypothetical protein V525_14895 [Gordonia alkanivorans CGMCC 6845]
MHCGHSVNESSENDWTMSNLLSHSVQAYE